jgi:hypothetical protein
MLCGLPALADTPVSSSLFSDAYAENPYVQQAKQSGYITKEIADYLLGSNDSLGAKAAVINALYFEKASNNNTPILLEQLFAKYNMTEQSLDVSMFSANDLMCLAYVNAMDNFTDVTAANNLIELAREKQPQSFTINMVWGLIQAQVYFFADDWCGVWKVCDNVVNAKSISQHDMRQQAIDKIFEYIVLYKESCGNIK